MVFYLIVTLLLIAAWLLGSISSAVLVSRVFSLEDPREQGSKNPGATNVLRLSGKKYAAMVLVADMLKGFIPVLVAKLLGMPWIVTGFVCFAAVIGHVFPVFFNFRGGKGVATALGALLAINMVMGVVAIATWLLIVYLTKYASLASILTLSLAPFYASIAVGSMNLFPPLFFTTILILFKHRENLTRLMDGEESKIHFTRNMADTLYQSEKKGQSPD